MQNESKWGTVNLGSDTLQGHGEQSQPGIVDYGRNHPNTLGKQQYNPGRNQQLNLPSTAFLDEKQSKKSSIHENIKKMIADGIPRKIAVKTAMNDSKITQKDIYRSKYQTPQNSKKIFPFSSQVQNYPYI